MRLFNVNVAKTEFELVCSHFSDLLGAGYPLVWYNYTKTIIHLSIGEAYPGQSQKLKLNDGRYKAVIMFNSGSASS